MWQTDEIVSPRLGLHSKAEGVISSRVAAVSDLKAVTQIDLFGPSPMNLGPIRIPDLGASFNVITVSAQTIERHHPADEKARKYPEEGRGIEECLDRLGHLVQNIVAPPSSLTKKRPKGWLLGNASYADKPATSAGIALLREL
jgi:hypothetical protein